MNPYVVVRRSDLRLLLDGYAGDEERARLSADLSDLASPDAPSAVPGRTETSRAASLRALPRSGTQRARVLHVLSHPPLDYGLTDEQIALALNMDPNAVRPRRLELVAGGWVEPARPTIASALDGYQSVTDPKWGQVLVRPTRSGANAIVWRAVPRTITSNRTETT